MQSHWHPTKFLVAISFILGAAGNSSAASRKFVAKYPRLTDLVFFFIHTGLRPGELFTFYGDSEPQGLMHQSVYDTILAVSARYGKRNCGIC